MTGHMKYLEQCIATLRQTCGLLPDKRTGDNCNYSMADIGMAAFSMFFMQHPSFLDFQRTLTENTGQNNTQTLFNLGKIPTDNHIRKMLDGVEPAYFEQSFFTCLDALGNNIHLLKNVLDGHTLIALDGSEYFCSRKVSCQACSTRKSPDGGQEFFHTFLAATIVAPGRQEVFCLPPEFIRPQDGDKKQDCELKAAKRWFERIGPACNKYNPIYLGDDLYAKNDICKSILEQGGSFIFTCKDTSHKTLAEFRKNLKLSTHAETHGTGSQKRKYQYTWVCELPIRDGIEALPVNWFDISIVNPTGKTTYHASFITNLSPSKENIAELSSCARARWKIENETFNVLKNNGYHLEHNFGHGQKTLASVLVVLNLLAFSLHNACDLLERQWQKAREACGTRSRLFIHLWSITRYHVFQSWDSLMGTLITGRPPPG